MNAITLKNADGMSASPTSAHPFYEDPLEADKAGDAAVSTTRRALIRLALVAAETGVRFQREGIGHDPMAWMLAPRQLFKGEAPLEACLKRENCLRAILMHGLSFGLDASPSQIDALLADDHGPTGENDWIDGPRGTSFGAIRRGRRNRLYSATIVVARGGEVLHAFHASFAPSAAVIRERIRARLGSAAAEQAIIRIGFDPECPSCAEMVPPAIMHTLSGAAQRSQASSLNGIDITVEQRLPS